MVFMKKLLGLFVVLLLSAGLFVQELDFGTEVFNSTASIKAIEIAGSESHGGWWCTEKFLFCEQPDGTINVQNSCVEVWYPDYCAADPC